LESKYMQRSNVRGECCAVAGRGAVARQRRGPGQIPRDAFAHRSYEDLLDYVENIAVPLRNLAVRDLQILVPHLLLIAAFFAGIRFVSPW
jgi:hypothetical protein